MIELVTFVVFALAVLGIVIEFIVHDVRGRRAVARENADRRAQYESACVDAKARRSRPPFPPNVLVWQ